MELIPSDSGIFGILQVANGGASSFLNSLNPLDASAGWSGFSAKTAAQGAAAFVKAIATDGFIKGGRGLFNPLFKGVYMATVGGPINVFVPAASRVAVSVATPAWTVRIIPYLVYLKAGAKVVL